MKLQAYYRLAKPGIIYGNLFTAVAGFLLASRGSIDFWLLVAAMVGISLVIASACVINNYIDQGIDAKMGRTKKRALVTGVIGARPALVYATMLGFLGFADLIIFTNTVTVILGAVAIITYVILYGISKRTTVWGTVIGSIAGALPPAGGYTAASGSFDLGGVLLFLIIVFWQMPHFYAIAIFRLKDYAAAGLPVLPVKKGIEAAKRQIMGYIVAFTVVATLLTIYGYTSYGYLIIVLLLGAAWFVRGLQGYRTTQPEAWARKLFFFSLIVMMSWSLTVMIDSFFH